MNKINDTGIVRKPADSRGARALRAAASGLSPSYFAMVMATGIVSLAAQALGMPRVAAGLFWLNLALYLGLWALIALRAMWFPRQMRDDLFDHQRAPGFFTLVAASCVLGSQSLVLFGAERAALGLWLAGLVLWLLLTYAVFAALAAKPDKPSLEQGIGGGWLLFVVAPQSIAVLAALLAGHGEQAHGAGLNFVALCFWLGGGMLYVWLTGLIFYRLAFFRLHAAELAPAYWINMGAMAISTLAGSLLIANAPGAPLLQSLLPFLKGATVLCWAIGTWWIPALVVLGVWRHGYQRVPLRYDPAYWSMVFPLGMYAAGTLQMERALDLRFLELVPQAFLYIALAAWLAAFGGLAHTLVRHLLAATER